MEITQLNAQIREKVGSGLNSLRKQNLIPAVIYGHNIEPKNIAVEYIVFQKAYEKAGESSLVDLKIGEEEPVKVLIQDIQKNAINDRIIHADFHQINMMEKLEADIYLEFIGESRAVKEANGILVKNADTITVECLPNALVSQIEIDLSALREFGDMIRAGDIKLPEGMELVDEPENVLVSVAEPRSEEELADTQKPIEENVESVEVGSAKKESEEVPVEESKA